MTNNQNTATRSIIGLCISIFVWFTMDSEIEILKISVTLCYFLTIVYIPQIIERFGGYRMKLFKRSSNLRYIRKDNRLTYIMVYLFDFLEGYISLNGFPFNTSYILKYINLFLVIGLSITSVYLMNQYDFSSNEIMFTSAILSSSLIIPIYLFENILGVTIRWLIDNLENKLNSFKNLFFEVFTSRY